MVFCWDDKGRFWVVENRDYEFRGFGFLNFGDSWIVILEDMDWDGKVDSCKVFLEGIFFFLELLWVLMVYFWVFCLIYFMYWIKMVMIKLIWRILKCD